MTSKGSPNKPDAGDGLQSRLIRSVVCKIKRESNMSYGQILSLIAPIVSIIACTITVLTYLANRRAQMARLTIDLVSLEKHGDRVIVSSERNLLFPAAIRVYNPSNYDLVITEVGIRVKKPQKADLSPEQPLTLEGNSLPYNISPRTACIVPLSGLDTWDFARRGIVTVFAKTDSGKEFRISRMKLSMLEIIYKTIQKQKDKPKREIID